MKYKDYLSIKCKYAVEFGEGNCWYKSKLLRDWNESARKAYIKALQEIEELPKIKGWVARDEDGSINYFEVKPERSYYGNYWRDRDYIQMSFEKEYFPELRWEDEPVEVEFLIRKI